MSYKQVWCHEGFAARTAPSSSRLALIQWAQAAHFPLWAEHSWGLVQPTPAGSAVHLTLSHVLCQVPQLLCSLPQCLHTKWSHFQNIRGDRGKRFRAGICRRRWERGEVPVDTQGSGEGGWTRRHLGRTGGWQKRW